MGITTGHHHHRVPPSSVSKYPVGAADVIGQQMRRVGFTKFRRQIIIADNADEASCFIKTKNHGSGQCEVKVHPTTPP